MMMMGRSVLEYPLCKIVYLSTPIMGVRRCSQISRIYATNEGKAMKFSAKLQKERMLQTHYFHSSMTINLTEIKKRRTFSTHTHNYKTDVLKNTYGGIPAAIERSVPGITVAVSNTQSQIASHTSSDKHGTAEDCQWVNQHILVSNINCNFADRYILNCHKHMTSNAHCSTAAPASVLAQ